MGKNKSPFEPKKATYFSPLNISHAMMKKVEKNDLAQFCDYQQMFLRRPLQCHPSCQKIIGWGKIGRLVGR